MNNRSINNTENNTSDDLNDINKRILSCYKIQNGDYDLEIKRHLIALQKVGGGGGSRGAGAPVVSSFFNKNQKKGLFYVNMVSETKRYYVNKQHHIKNSFHRPKTPFYHSNAICYR
ncbi:hypothetical protein HELRODRAFT_177679 [Helobdella robusta]|uniref:Uncharacterized protein n=1 Tax=Helobdella robusta TaxID=6412 RepID=T1FC25_HELRO|nr:hypothetical protein HELRODRAFT_177679 [Helobdella robusta]ESN98006.1 hypothetical protein HELRODRAFT_177679 [Helobdella robusta]